MRINHSKYYVFKVVDQYGTGEYFLNGKSGFVNQTTSTRVAKPWSACCGARDVYGWEGDFTVVRKGISVERMQQDWLALFLNNLGMNMRVYTIATDWQRNHYKEGPLALMLELGMKAAESHPNQNHHGNQMELYVWTAVDNRKAIDKYVHYDQFNGHFIPRWMANMSDAQFAEYEKSPEALALVAVNEKDKLAKQQIELTNQFIKVRQSVVNILYLTAEQKQALYKWARDSKYTWIIDPEILKAKDKEIADLRAQLYNKESVTEVPRAANGRFIKVGV